MGIRCNEDGVSQGELVIHLTSILNAEARCEVGHRRRGENRNCRISPPTEETEGSTEGPSGGDEHVGLHRSDVRVCGEEP